MENIKHVYITEIEGAIEKDDDQIIVRTTLGVYEDIDDAIAAIKKNNIDSYKTTDDVKKELLRSGMADAVLGTMKIGDYIIPEVNATLTKHVLIKSTKGS